MAHGEQWMIYGAYGFTGALIARRAKELGWEPVLGGRDATRLQPLADELALPQRVFALDSPADLDAGIAGMQLVLHCAGPFSKLSRPMIDACLRQNVHYLDLTAELAVIEAVLARDQAARNAGITLLPSVGLNVVPTDCMAVLLKKALPDATGLELGIAGPLKPSPGSARTAVEGLALGLKARRNGELVSLKSPLVKRLRLGGKERALLSLPLGDLATAYHSTGISNITAYLEVPSAMIHVAKAMDHITPALKLGPIRRLLQAQAAKRAAGPSAEERRNQRMWIWGRVENVSGANVEGLLETPEGYELTVRTALECVARVRKGEAKTGALSPAAAFGPSLLTDLPGVGSLEIVRRC